jgi:hypothetical protein
MKNGNQISKAFFLILLCVSLLTFNMITTNAKDLTGSAFIMPSDSLALHMIELTVYVTGAGGDVNNAIVGINCTSGTFDNSTADSDISSTDSVGIASFWWIAPDPPTELNPIDVKFIANISHDVDFFAINQNITVHPIEFSASTMLITPDPIYELHNSSVEVNATSLYEPYGVDGAIIDLTCDEGYFVDTLTATTQLNADSSGYATVDWNANLSIVISDPTLVNFTATITYTGKTANIVLNDNITVNPLDLASSTLLLSSNEVSGSEVVTVTTRAVGTYGPVSNAEIFIDALDGVFPSGYENITGTSDSNGYFVTTWTAPEVSANISYDITAEFRYPTTALLETLVDSVLVRADVHDFANITVEADASIVDEGELVELTLTVTNELFQFVEDANATFTAAGGTFVGSGYDNITVQTDASGIAVVTWNTSETNPTIGGFDFNITVTLIKEYYNTNESSVLVHVNPIIYQLETDSNADPTTITKGANVTITVHVTANGLDVEGATIQILTQSGIFAVSSEESAAKNSDASGIVTFIWITADMTVSQARDFTFTIGATLPGYDDSTVEEITVHVEPDPAEQTTPTDDEGLSSFEKLGVLFGVVGGIVLLSLGAYLIFRKKPVYY